jgi:DNA repair exonuclease SbcCD ATPase subunit
MKINKIEINNFYSIKNMSLDFDKFSGLVLLEGENLDTGGSNGAGKSTIIEAVVWGLFGRTVRKSTEEALVNNQAKKKCSVTITVDGDTVIHRSKRPAKLTFIHQGEDRTQDKALATQREIESLLDINYKVFLASTVFGQENNVDFISASADDKRTIIRNFLDLESIFGLRESVKFLKAKYSQERKATAAVIASLTKQVETIDKKIEEASTLRTSAESEYPVEVLTKDFEEIAKIHDEIDDLRQELAKTVREQATVQRKIDQYNNFNGQCFECEQDIPDKRNPELLNTLKENLYIGSTLCSDLEKIIEKRSSKVLPLKEIHKITRYQAICGKIDTYIETKEELLEQLDEKYKHTHGAEKDYEIMRFWEKAFSEAGLVKYIIRNILGYFNSQVNYYLTYLANGKYKVTFDEELGETILYDKRELSFMSLSGGEKKRVNLAVMLALQGLLTLSNKAEGNLLFFDEVATFVDEDGVEGLYILLQELKKSKTLFIITHDYHLKSLLGAVKTLKVIKKDGITEII